MSSAIVLPAVPDEAFSETINDDDDSLDYIATTKLTSPDESNVFLSWLKYSTDFLLEFLAPIVWGVLFMLIMNRQSMLELWYMPFLGIAAALLANSVPIGGGIVYIPVLHLLGVHVHLGVAFTVAVMTFGNGYLGFLRWLNKDDSLIVWESFPFTVVPSSLGTLIAVYLVPRPNIVSIRRLFAGFCILLGILVGLASINGGISKTLSPLFRDIMGRSKLSDLSSGSMNKWIIIAVISFLAGFILVPNIGVGPALTTYILLEFYGYAAEQAIVTGIVTGGWVCIVPLLIHGFGIRDVPWEMWVMVLPGVYYGAKFAPAAHAYVGIRNILAAFSIFLFCTSYLFLSN